MPKLIGPLAQDVEKAAPGSTAKVKGVMAVPRETLVAATPSVAQHPQHAANVRRYASGTSFVLPDMTSDMGEQSTWKMGGGADSREEALGMARPELEHLQDQRDFDRAMGRTPRNYASGTSVVKPQSMLAFTPPSSPGVAKGIGALSAFHPPTRMPRGFGMPTMPKHKYAEGATRIPGQGPGDTVPAMLTPGEAVLNRHAADHLGRDNIAALNAMMPKGRQKAETAVRAGSRGIQGALSNTKLRPKIAGGLSG